MHDSLEQFQNVFHAKVFSSQFSSKQRVIKQLLDLVFVISGIIKVKVVVISID